MSETELYGIKPRPIRRVGLSPMTITVNRDDISKMREHFPEFSPSYFFRTQLARTLVQLEETKRQQVKKKDGKA